MRTLALLLALSALAPRAAAEPTYVWRMASIAPDGTAWARMFKTLAREIAAGTGGAVKMRWYFGGIAGDEVQTGERIRRGQLDGVASGGMLCERLAPSLRATRLIGVFRDRDEWSYVVGRLRATFDAEFQKSGFANLGEATIGPETLFSRAPVRSFADLKRGHLWLWDLDEALRVQFQEMGVEFLPLPIDQARRAYDENRIDAFLGVPTAALAFQWSSQARYLSELDVGLLSGCLVVASRAFDELPIEYRQVVATATANMVRRFDEIGRAQDEALLGDLFARQGIIPVKPSDGFRGEFAQAAQAAQERLGEKLVPRALLSRVHEMLLEYRAERGAAGDKKR